MEPLHPAVKALIPVTFLVGLLGLVGNGLLLFVLRRSKTVHRSYGISLSILALTDSLNILLILLHLTNEALRQVNIRHFLYRDSASCKALDFITYCGSFASAWLVVYIACERFLVIYFPLRGRICCRTSYVAIIGLVLCLAAALQLPRLWFAEYEPVESVCALKMTQGRFALIAAFYHSYIRFLFFYGLPCLLIFSCNLLVIIRVHGFTRRTAAERLTEYRRRFGVPAPASPSLTISCNAQRDRQRATQILLIISCTYLLCFAPDTICELYFAIKLPSWLSPGMADLDQAAFVFFAQFDRVWRFVFQVLTLISYGANFYTYLLFGKRFRKEISSLLPAHSSTTRAGVPPKGIEARQMRVLLRR